MAVGMIYYQNCIWYSGGIGILTKCIITNVVSVSLVWSPTQDKLLSGLLKKLADMALLEKNDIIWPFLTR